MRRHRAMEFVGGVMVFPGGGVDDRDRNADIAWYGPGHGLVGASGSASTPTWPRRWCARRPGRRSRSPACCSPGRPTIRTASSTTRRSTATHGRRWSSAAVVRRLPARARTWCCAPTCCGRGRTGSPPKEERTRRYDTYFFVGALPDGQRADGENTESDQADWVTPEAAIEDFAEAQRSFLLPPTWTQLDSLAGRTVAEVLAVERQIVADLSRT